MRICMDCRYMERDGRGNALTPAICLHPETALRSLNYVTGAQTTEPMSCMAARTLGKCKPEGSLFEATEGR